MFLKKVEISGFKSFAQKSSLEFLPTCYLKSGRNSHCGITAIVGPNGSGKSNIADAIRWAMGEQSMKNLRGKKSEDIIFSGSGKKARMGSAMVTLYFDNSDKKLPVDFSEVTITRKLFRSGESEYLINGRRVRLIDVIDLLAKAGVGRESYCVINQGMSDAVLSANPVDRRTIIEDAAGVKPYQIKKERALRKLESTEINLQRVGDLISEITPHLRLLKRQADKAAKSKDLAEKLRENQHQLYSWLWHNFQSEKDKISMEKRQLGIEMMNLQRAVDKLNDEVMAEENRAENTDHITNLEKEREKLFGLLNKLERDLVVSDGRLQIEKEKMAKAKKEQEEREKAEKEKKIKEDRVKNIPTL